MSRDHNPSGGQGVAVQVWGDAALFTRPEFKSERISYAAITPTAAVGVLEAIYWHPGMVYRVRRIEVLRPIKQFPIRRNETSVVPSVSSALAGHTLDTAATSARTQRMSLCLHDVAYRIHAWIDLTEDAGKAIGGYLDQFNRRVRRGACFSQPYLGAREFPADFGPADDTPPQKKINLDMGLMPHSAIYDRDGRVRQWRWFHARLRAGVIDVTAPLNASSAAAVTGEAVD